MDLQAIGEEVSLCFLLIILEGKKRIFSRLTITVNFGILNLEISKPLPQSIVRYLWYAGYIILNITPIQ